ncbi:MAG: hypothetical protein EGR16_05350 [Clostridiales bacterium]|nr:hypothetical protein [Clostridiales bacterium]
MFNDDRSFIENKYHKTDEPFNPYSRMAYHGYDFDKSTGLEDEEIKDGLSKLYEKTKDLPHPVAKAYAVKYVLENTKIDINEHDLFVGLWSVNRLANSVTLNKWNAEVFETILPKVKQKMNDMNESGAVAIWPDFDHVVPDWDAILKLGFPGLKKRAEEYKELHKARGTLTPETAAFFDGIIIEYTTIIALVDRLYRLALTQNHDKAKKVAECLLHIRDGAPQNIYETMQVIYIYFMVSECFDSYQVRSLGNGLDNTLYGFYKNDLKSGTYTKEEIKELFRYFLFQWSAIGNYWGQPFYMGGTNADGSTKYNELSYDILDVYDELGIYNPKIQVKINENTPDRLLFKVFDMIRRGKSCFALCCEPGMIKAVMGYGSTYEEALNMDIRGCYETGVRANEVSSATGYVNALKSVEYVFSNGFDSRIGKHFGLKTGELKDLKTFEDFYSAVLKQWENLIEMTIDVSKQYEKYLSFINPSNMYSATIEGALKKGADAYQSGVKFNNSALLNCGFASLVDAIMAVKELVYDKKDVTLETLSAALAADWKGFEDLHTKVVKSLRKYGNDDAETDRYTEAMSAYFASKVNNRPNARGGVYKAIMHTAMEFVWEGEKTGATPDGRYAGDEISKNGSPSVGMDREGVTALIKSALKARPYTYCESFCLDVMLHPTAVSGDEGLEIMKSLLFMYMKNGGQTMQFNVFNTETLRDAQKRPEKYQNLQVRVCGWNVLWNNLSEKEQNAYITRAENIR